MFRFVPLLVLPTLCSAFFGFGSGPDWNALKVKWDPLLWRGFDSMPRTRAAAEADGWVNMAPEVACNGNPLFRGERYWKDNEYGVILIFDPAGYIAGIQAGITEAYHPNPNGFPSSYLQDHPFVLEDGIYYITAYFVNPANLCNGRTAEQFLDEGTGLGLWIQNGTNPLTQSVRAPPTQSEADNSMWTKGKCFYSMGYHYWYNITQDMSCDSFYPVFLMYNNGKLDSFGWAFGMNIEGSSWLEHPPQGSYKDVGSKFAHVIRSDVATIVLTMGQTPNRRFVITGQAIPDFGGRVMEILSKQLCTTLKWDVQEGFVSVPRTRAEAIADGWVNMTPGVACNGERYWKGGQYEVILIFGPLGYIAGIQAGIAEDIQPNPNGYPSSYLQDHPFVLEDGIYYITAYFVNPAKLCNGRTARQFKDEGKGMGLWIQNGTDPLTQSVRAPRTQKKADKSMWTRTKCFYTMGYHYWYNISKDMTCDRFYPVFLLYNDGKLDSFGWAFGINIEGSSWYEHPAQRVYPTFLDPVPDCLYTVGTITTLHIFLTSNPRFNFC